MLQFGALDERESITREMVDEVAEEMMEGLNGEAPAQVESAPGSPPNGFNPLASRSAGEPGDLLHRIEALEEITAMGGPLSWRYMEPVLEWVLLLAVGASALCMLALATVMILDRYRLHRK